MKKAFVVFIVAIFLTWCFIGCSEKEKTVNAPEVGFAIDGHVRQSVTLEKVPGVVVSLAGQVCTTNTSGYYYFKDVQSGSYHLTADKYGSTLFETDIDLVGLLQYDFKINYDISLYGWVAHPVDGPIEGATVQAGDSTAVTSRTGYYEFVGLVPGTYPLTCEKEGYLDSDTNVTIDADFTLARIKLTRFFAQVHGIVSHPVDGPIEGAMVQLDTLLDTTTAGGFYGFNSVAIGSHRLQCEAEGYTPIDEIVNVADTTASTDIEMARLFSKVFGIVSSSADGPIANAIVRIDALADTTSADGHYSIDGISRGRRTITCQAAGNSNVEMDVDIERDYFEMNIEVDKLYSIFGVVYHEADGPLEGVTVSVEDFVATTDDHGYYSLNIPQGTHEIRCVKPGYNEYVNTIDVEYSQALPSIRMLKTVTDFEQDITDDFSTLIEEKRLCPSVCYEPDADNQYINIQFLYMYIGGECVTSEWHSSIYMKFESEFLSYDPEIGSVDLYLYVNAIDNAQYFGDIMVYLITSAWDEEDVSCDSMPTTQSNLWQSFQIPELTVDEPMVIDIKDLLSRSTSEVYGVRISFSSLIGGWAYGIEFYSSECPDVSKRPKIIGTFTY